jgi:hypothetical protein
MKTVPKFTKEGWLDKENIYNHIYDYNFGIYRGLSRNIDFKLFGICLDIEYTEMGKK